MAEVIGLDGRQVEKPDNVNHGVVSLLERLLGEARAGRVSAVSVAYQTPDDDGTLYQSDWAGPRITLLGALTRALYAMNRSLDQEDVGRIGGSP